ncbi:MAG: lipocalin family protein [Spongiibacter sp.]
MRRSVVGLVSLLLAGCLGMPEGVTPVKGFDIHRYMGKWYEIARLDHSFERGLEQVTAEYTLGSGGRVEVVNRGYSAAEQQWQSAEGKAFLVDKADEGYLKVSFFGPFYGSYVVFELERENYDYAFVSGPNTNYLWLLSRTPSVPPEVIERFRMSAGELGFDTRGLIFVEHSDAALH